MRMKNSFTEGSKLSISMIFILICSFSFVIADVTLPGVISDHMVLQRDMDVKIWGWADQNESVIIRFNNQEKKTVAGLEGMWQVKLSAMTHGGPFEMTIEGKNTIVLKNILIGDVWICSGQSNMEWRVQNTNNAQEEIAVANFPEIRLFDVKHRMAAEPKDNLADEKWQVCSPKTISAFSAVGYFFGQELHKNLNIPIGLISTNWGGTVSETWTSAGTINDFSEFDEKMKKLKSINLDEMIEKRVELQQEWEEKVDKSDRGMQEEWYRLSQIDASWKDMDLPQAWEKAGLEGFDGIVWFIREIELSKNEAQKDMQLNLGPIDDTDFTYVNGIQVGHVKKSWRKLREYVVSSDVLKPGRNILCVRVIDYGGSGGLHGKSEDLFYSTSEKKVSLAGIWKFKIGTDKMPEQVNIGPNSFPTLLYNGMVHPLLSYAIKGAIWYQGESNAGRAYQYRKLFPAMITDWRKSWGQGDFPFFFVQLANFRQPVTEPQGSTWAELREAQNMALQLPNTGVAVIIDIGEAEDIHPRNKQDVGYRLSLAARKIAYAQDLVYSGPMYKSMQVEKNKIRIKFSHTGSGLTIRDQYGYLKGFSISGNDRKFVWAKAYQDGDDVIVYSDKIKKPVAVRYGWADNPHDVNLYNKEGLPASPFRTDDWPGITK